MVMRWSWTISCATLGPVNTRMGDRLTASKPFRCSTRHQVNTGDPFVGRCELGSKQAYNGLACVRRLTVLAGVWLRTSQTEISAKVW